MLYCTKNTMESLPVDGIQLLTGHLNRKNQPWEVPVLASSTSSASIL